jgi:hypothetical protein
MLYLGQVAALMSWSLEDVCTYIDQAGFKSTRIIMTSHMAFRGLIADALLLIR